MDEKKDQSPKSEDEKNPPVDNRPLPRSPLTEMRDIHGTRDKKYESNREQSKRRKDSDD
jgi:hypothetical protein